MIIKACPTCPIIDSPCLNDGNLLPANPALTQPLQPPTTHALATPSHPQPTDPPLQLSHKDAARINAAEYLHFLYNHPNDQYLASAINNKLIDTTVTAADILLNRQYRGPCIHCLEGKLKEISHPANSCPLPTRIGEELTIDIHELSDKSVGGNTHSVRCVDIFSNQINQEAAKTKQVRDILTAILKIITTHYNAHQHYVSKIFTDSETVLRALRAQLGIFGIVLQLATPGDHARRFERHNQTLTSKSRATRASLPYILPKKYNLQLDADTMHKTNIIPNKSSPTMPPFQQVTNSLPPTPVGLFGHVYMVKLHDDQRTLISNKQHIPMKDTDKGTIAVHMGQNPLCPSAPQVLLPNGVITARHLQSTALPVIPFGWTPKPRTHQPILPHTATTSSASPIIQLAPTLPLPPTQPPTSNLPVQPTPVGPLQDAIFNAPTRPPPIPSPIASEPAHSTSEYEYS